MWHKAYPQFKKKVVYETWCGRPALMMPHFSAITAQKREEMLGLIEHMLREDFDRRGLVHGDVAWRNVGLYKKGEQTKAVVFDMAKVEEKKLSNGQWVEVAFQKLRGANR